MEDDSRLLPTAPSSPRGGRDLVATVEWTLLIAGAVLQALFVPHLIGGDGLARYLALVQWADEGTVSAGRYSIAQPLLAWPWFALGAWFGKRPWVTAHFAVSIFLATLFACWRLLRAHVDAVVLRRMLLLLVSASMFGHHVQTFYGETLTACAAMLGVVLLARDRTVAAGLAMTVAVVNSPAAIVALALCNLAWAARSRRLLHAAWPLALSVALVLLEFQLRRGSPWLTGYEGDVGFRTLLPYSGRPGFSYPWLLGVVSLLFSFGKGLLFFAPGAALAWVPAGSAPGAVEARVRAGALAFTAGLVAVYAPWWAWYGGWFWGPRFLLFASFPASLVLARHLARLPATPGARALVAIAAALSAWVGIDGSVYGLANLEVCLQSDYQLEFLCWYVPEFSALARPFVVSPPLAAWQRAVLAHGVLVGLVLAGPALASLARDGAHVLRRLRPRQPGEASLDGDADHP